MRIQNEWGGAVITCERHRTEQTQGLLGTLTIHESDSPCPKCEQEAKLAALPGRVRAALIDPKFSHTRFRGWCGVGCVYIYHRDDTSPSGVMLAEGCDEAMYESIAAQLKAEGHRLGSPLSPTEGL